jgi:sulfite exporter TauE/SafE
VCSLIGSLSVMSVKGFGLSLVSTFQGRNEMGKWLTWFCVGSLILSVGIQMNFLNKVRSIDRSFANILLVCRNNNILTISNLNKLINHIGT